MNIDFNEFRKLTSNQKQLVIKQLFRFCDFNTRKSVFNYVDKYTRRKEPINHARSKRYMGNLPKPKAKPATSEPPTEEAAASDEAMASDEDPIAPPPDPQLEPSPANVIDYDKYIGLDVDLMWSSFLNAFWAGGDQEGSSSSNICFAK